MVLNAGRFYNTCLIAVMMVFLLSSCGAKRKVAHRGYEKRTESRRSSPVRTDASDSRDRSLSGSKMDNYAQLLGVSTKALGNKTLYAFIDEWMGSPHRLGGLEKSGIDCSGFVGMLYRQVYRQDLPRTSRDMGDHVKRKYENELREGDLVFFSFGGKNIDHVGVYLHNHKFIHVSTSKGVIISDMRDSWYYKYFVRCGTPKI